MRLPPHLVAALAQHLARPDPPDLVSPVGAGRAQLLRLAGAPDRFASLRYALLDILRRHAQQRPPACWWQP